MNAQQPFRRSALMASVLLVFAASYGWLCAADQAQPLSSARAAQTGKSPQQVLIIRHAEKPTDDTDKDLSSRGAGRGAAVAIPDSANVQDQACPVRHAGLPVRHGGIQKQQPPRRNNYAAFQGA